MKTYEASEKSIGHLFFDVNEDTGKTTADSNNLEQALLYLAGQKKISPREAKYCATMLKKLLKEDYRGKGKGSSGYPKSSSEEKKPEEKLALKVPTSTEPNPK